MPCRRAVDGARHPPPHRVRNLRSSRLLIGLMRARRRRPMLLVESRRITRLVHTAASTGARRVHALARSVLLRVSRFIDVGRFLPAPSGILSRRGRSPSPRAAHLDTALPALARPELPNNGRLAARGRDTKGPDMLAKFVAHSVAFLPAQPVDRPRVPCHIPPRRDDRAAEGT